MNLNNVHITLKRLLGQWRRRKMYEGMIFTLGIWWVVASGLKIFTSLDGKLILITAICSWLLAQVSIWFLVIKPAVDLKKLVKYLDRRYIALEESTGLLLESTAKLTSVARLQQRLVASRLREIEGRISMPWRAGAPGLSLFLSIILSFTFYYLPQQRKGFENPAVKASDRMKITGPDRETITIPVNYQIIITPPSYTRLPVIRQQDPNLLVPSGSSVRWQLYVSRPLQRVWLKRSTGAATALDNHQDQYYLVEQVLQAKGYYYFSFQPEEGKIKSSDLYKIEVIPDQAPKIKIEGLEPYSSLDAEDLPEINLQISMEDDYGIIDAFILATLSRGSGEQVKFRNDTLRLRSTNWRVKKSQQLNFVLSLPTLNLQPGDELYLHAEAWDAKAQMGKTAKYLIELRDTTELAIGSFDKLGVDRMPAYFRSQRQIIIDTEQLIADSQQFRKAEFNNKSNNIAIDQKLLRLRYGKFLGEELVTVIGPTDALAEEQEDEHSEHGHDHGEDNADPVPTGEEGEDTLLSSYAHLHDLTEQANFFDEATNAKLRAALSEMWNAELHLRMGRPDQALPYEYRALRLIKAIQQASRIYVARIGFDPPMINIANTRLSGELEKVSDQRIIQQRSTDDRFPKLRAALPFLEEWLEGGEAIGEKGRTVLEAAAGELAAEMLDQPIPVVTVLQQLRSLIEETLPHPVRIQYLQNIRQAFWSLLPEKENQPFGDRPGSRLSESYLIEMSRI